MSAWLTAKCPLVSLSTTCRLVDNEARADIAGRYQICPNRADDFAHQSWHLADDTGD